MFRATGIAVAAWIAALAPGAQAQTTAIYPVKPIRVIVPLAPGGNQDIVARAIAEELSKGLGEQVVVENRPGASALVGTQAVAKSAADGYTLLSVSNTFARAPVIVANAGYDPVKDFVGVSLVSRIPMVLEVNPGVSARSVGELIALAKAKPGEISYASSGSGSTGHVAAELFSRMAGVKMLHVPYKGNAQAIVDVLSGQVTAMFDQVSTSVSYIRADKLRALAVTTRTRSPLFPEVPTMEEAGLSGFEDVTWNGLVAPAGTPREVLERLHREIERTVSAPELRKRYLDRGIELTASVSPEEFGTYIKSEVEAFARLAREANIKGE
jgi:tripartite-type tricarboxylate transporter receptor subunit TctC